MSRRTRFTPPHTHIALLYWPIILPRYLYEDDDAYDIYDDDANDDDDGVDGDNDGMYFLKTLETWYTDGIACQVISRSSSSFTVSGYNDCFKKREIFSSSEQNNNNNHTIIVTSETLFNIRLFGLRWQS